MWRFLRYRDCDGCVLKTIKKYKAIWNGSQIVMSVFYRRHYRDSFDECAERCFVYKNREHNAGNSSRHACYAIHTNKCGRHQLNRRSSNALNFEYNSRALVSDRLSRILNVSAADAIISRVTKRK